MNNKGQVLVVFILIMPILLLLGTYIVDLTYLYYHSNKLNEINDLVIKETNDKKLSVEQINEYIKLNDDEVHIANLNITNEKIEITLQKKVKSLFGKIIGKDSYVLTSTKIVENTNNGLLVY